MTLYYDILLDDDGDLPIVTRHAIGAEVVAQRVRFRLETFEGEWILDTAVGLPYLKWRGTKVVNLDAIGARIQRELLTVPGVLRMTAFSSEFTADAQRVYFNISLVVEDVAGTASTTVAYYPFGLRANAFPIALYTAPSRVIL